MFTMAHPVVASRLETSLWPAVLVVVSAAGTLGFACVTPFAAFALAAAYVLPVRAALLAVAGVWLANQAVGYAALGYPWTVDTLLWGGAIGAAALAATAAASFVLRALAGRGTVAALGVALLVAFCVYEAGLVLVTPVLGGQEAFTPRIVGEFALLNLAWAAALVGALEAWRSTRAWALPAAGRRA
jgi:hypothetical protein